MNWSSLARRVGRLADLSGGNLDVLALEGADHILRGQSPGRELVRIEPDAHRIRPDAADHDIADASHAAQRRRGA